MAAKEGKGKSLLVLIRTANILKTLRETPALSTLYGGRCNRSKEKEFYESKR